MKGNGNQGQDISNKEKPKQVQSSGFKPKGRWKKECMGGCGMLCVMHVVDEFEPKEVTNLVNLPKCVK